MKNGLRLCVSFALICLISVSVAKAAGPLINLPKTPAPVQPSSGGKFPLPKYVKTRVDAALALAQEKGDFDTAQHTLAELFDQVIANGKDTDVEAFREADFGLRLVTQLQSVPTDKQVELLRYLRANGELGRTLVFLIKPTQKPAEVYAVLDALREKRGEQLEKYANLAAAICVVHTKPFVRHINENTAKAPEPLEIFDYYVKNESHMLFGVRAVPAELLIWVVDTTASIDDMTWALSKYAGDKLVGRRFFDIKYDYDNFKSGTPKKITSAGFTLPNILEYGGVCADQAYFAMSVGKAIGVPTAYTVGAAAETGHAWVGFLQAGKGTAGWNFNVGRYTAYKGVRGNVHDPQLNESVPDSQVSVLAELIGTKANDRQTSVALTDAALRLIALQKENKALEAAFPADASVSNLRPAPRKAQTADALALIELSLKQSAGYPPAWFAVRDLAKDDKLSLKDKKHWADLLQRLGGPKYPDFTLSVLIPMVQTITDHKEQNALWNAAFTMFQARFDLAASIRMEQAKGWETQNDVESAGKCYMDVIDRFANAGPFVIDALKKAEKLLVDSKHGDKVVMLYEQTWKKIEPPREMNADATAESNWYRVGKLYAEKLKEAGKNADADTVTEQLKNPSAMKKAASNGK